MNFAQPLWTQQARKIYTCIAPELITVLLLIDYNFKIITTEFITTEKEAIMSNPNPNDTKLEQQRSESATAALKGQTEDNHTQDTEAAADRIADNLKNAKEEK